jgi:hypothetical protein
MAKKLVSMLVKTSCSKIFNKHFRLLGETGRAGEKRRWRNIKHFLTINLKTNNMKKLLLLFTFIGFASGIFAQVSKTVNLATAGTLPTVLTAGELNTVTNLTITGKIDARDFKTMRDKMPLLAVLDLNGVTVVAYNGTEGTSPNFIDYRANAIPDYAFLNPAPGQSKTSLISVVLPSLVTSIGNWAFSGCTGLITVAIPSSVTSIGNWAFGGCSGLTTVTIPSSVISIGNYAFYYCRGLSTVTIPSSVTSIGVGAFWGCSGLITVDSNNPNYSGIDGVLYDKTQTTLIKCTI